MARHPAQMTKVPAIHRSEDKVALLLRVCKETQRSKELGEPFAGNHSAGREDADHFVLFVEADHRGVRLHLHQIQYLSVTEKKLHAIVYYFLEDEVFVVVAHVCDVCLY